MALRGIDVSTNNGIIDWRKAAKAVDFAIIKATQGRGAGPSTALLRRFTDSKFTYNVNNAAVNGLSIGVYHFLNCSTVKEAEAEADYFIKAISPYRGYIDIFAAVDVEDPKEMYAHLPKDKPTLTAMVNTFTERVRQAGFKPAIYTNRAFLAGRLDYNNLKCKTIWRAHWYTQYVTSFDEWRPSDAPTDYADDMPVWQFGKGAQNSVDGVKTKIDLNYGYFANRAKSPDYAAMVCEKCGLEQQTRDYIDRYTYAEDLWRKLWNAME